MTPTLYYLLCAVLSVAVLLGISMMSRVKTAVREISQCGQPICGDSRYADLQRNCLGMEHLSLHGGRVVIGSALAIRVKMIEMPQMVALLNGVGGLASAWWESLHCWAWDTPPSITRSLPMSLLSWRWRWG